LPVREYSDHAVPLNIDSDPFFLGGLFDQIWRQICSVNALNANKSAGAAAR
jgi:hypothetical protein